MPINKPSYWLRIPALCTALGLGGSFVWWKQQKASPPVTIPDERTVISSSKSLVISPSALPVNEKESDLPAPPKETPPQQRLLLSGSKSGIFLLKQEESEQRILLPGSKSGSLTLDPPKSKDP
jgi:hypothetical protein